MNTPQTPQNISNLTKLLEQEPNPRTRLDAAKDLYNNFKDKSESILSGQIQIERSAFFLTQFYKFLCNQEDNLSYVLKERIVNKYQRIYDVEYNEVIFFIDLESTQINIEKELDFKVGYFKKFSESNLNKLEKDNQINIIIESRHVQALDLSRWEFEKIPESICYLSELVYLNLSDLNLTHIPETISQLSRLNYLNLNGNSLTEIPDWLIEFSKSNLTKEYIKEGVNKVDSCILGLFEVLCGSKINKALTQEDVISWERSLNYKIDEQGCVIGLYIRDEKLEIGIIPEQLCSFESLQELDLPKSSIEFIPKCIGELISLKFLNLSLNRIKLFPESIHKLKNLEYLNIDENLLSEQDLMDVIWNKNGLHFLENNQFQKAIEECEATLKIYPKNLLALFHLGIAYREMGNLELSKQAYKKFLDINTQSSVVWSSLSDIHHQEGDYDKAISAIETALSIEPGIALLWSNLGLNYKKLGKYNNAIKAYMHSLEIDQKNKYVWKDLASIYRDKGEFMKAIEAEERALEIEFRSDKNKD